MKIKITVCSDSFNATETLPNGLAKLEKALVKQWPQADVETELLTDVSGGDNVFCSDDYQLDDVRQFVTNFWERTDWWL